MLELMTHLAERLAAAGYVLRSGHAKGVDQAFEAGAGRQAQIFLPWASYEEEQPIQAAYTRPKASSAAFPIAAKYHPAWSMMKRGSRLLHARNVHQVLGDKLDQPAAFVVCWTPDGTLTGKHAQGGGTGQAIRIACAYEIPVFNLQVPAHLERIQMFLARS